MYLRKKTIGTHNGVFHEDDVLAVSLLSILYDDHIIVKRSRDNDVLSTCDIVVDVGGGKYDHHISGEIKARENGIKYASAGLIWKDFGVAILKKLCNDSLPYEEIFEDMDVKLIQPVDKKDNGIKATSPISFVDSFLPLWTEENPDFDGAFNEAVKVTKEIAKKLILQEIAETKAHKVINDAIIASRDNNTNILFIPCQNMPWQTTLIAHNFNNHIFKEEYRIFIDFVVFPYPAGGYAAQCVPESFTDLFSKRIPFPENWAGQTDELAQISGIPESTFCHINRFFARAKSKEGITEMCNRATEIYNLNK